MLDPKTLASLLEVASTNMAFNLDFIPADKTEWKPAPDAKSALEVSNEVLTNLQRIVARLNGASQTPPEPKPAANAVEAKAQLRSLGSQAARLLREAFPETLQTTVEMRPGVSMPLGQLAAMMTIDAIHHHGQIAYIQTLLGDAESHFEPSIFAMLA